MNAPTALLTITWLVRDTVRQALASGIFWIMLTISALSILFCLSVEPVGGITSPPVETAEFLPPRDPDAKDAKKTQHSGVQVINGEVNLAFGLFRAQMGRDRVDAVRHIQVLLAGGVADTLGLLLSLVFTAGFVPTFLDPSAISVLLAKPVPRWSLLTGKYFGVVAFLFFNAVIFVGGTWLALGLRTGVWEGAYLLAIPLLVVQFAAYFSFSTLVAVCTRSTVACVFGSILFWAMSWSINYGRFMIVTQSDMDAMTPLMKGVLETFYWVLPKPFDMSLILVDALQAGTFFPAARIYTTQYASALSPEMSVVTGICFAIVTLGVSAWQFVKTDY